MAIFTLCEYQLMIGKTTGLSCTVGVEYAEYPGEKVLQNVPAFEEELQRQGMRIYSATKNYRRIDDIVEGMHWQKVVIVQAILWSNQHLYEVRRCVTGVRSTQEP